MIKRIVYISFFLLPYIGMIGFPILPTWRIANIFFIIFGFIYLNPIKSRELPIKMLFFLSLFIISVLISYYDLVLYDNFSSYELGYIVSIIPLFLISPIVHILIKRESERVWSCLKLGVYISFFYQIFQEITVLLKMYNLTKILNQYDVYKVGAFIKYVNGVVVSVGGFMMEPAHLDLFLGPLVITYLIYAKRKNLKTDFKFIFVCIGSIILTFSAGGAIQLFFILICVFLINSEKLLKTKQILVYIIIAIISYGIALKSGAWNTLVRRYDKTLDSSSVRIQGAIVFWEKFKEIPFFGNGPKTSRRVSKADPNMVTNILADHGIIGISILLLFFFSEFFSKQNPNVFISLLPIIAMLFQLFIAYGTFTWSILFINLGLCTGMLSIKSEAVTTKT